MTAIHSAFGSYRMKAVCAALFMAFPALAAAAVAGRVQFVSGDVRIVDAAGRQQPMKKGQDINEGDTVLSAQGGTAQLKMIDGAIVAVRPSTQLKIVGYVFNGKEDGTENAFFSLAKGGLRAITGLIGKTNKDRYKLETPTVVIGIRGTDHEPVVVLPSTAGETLMAPPGTYDKVNVGATSMTTQAGTVVVAANQVGFAASPTQLPVILPKLPDFYRVTAAPQAKQEKKEEKEQKQEQKQEAQASSEQSSSESSQGETRTAETAVAPAETAVATVTDATRTATLTATDATGNTLDLSNQRIVTSTGQTVDIGTGTGGTPTRPLESTTEFAAVYPHTGQTNTPGEIYYFPAGYYFDGPSSGVTRDSAGHVTSVSSMNLPFDEYRASISQSGSTLTDLGKHAAAGLSWGRWQGGSVMHSYQHFGMDSTGKFGLGASDASGNFVIGATYSETTSLGKNSLHWIAGSGGSPGYLAQVLTGTANYTMVGGTNPTDTLGNTGTLNSASLTANFTAQTVDASVNFSIAGNSWSMKGSGMPLDDTYFGGTERCSSTAPCTSSVIVTKNGTTLGSGSTPTAGNSSFGFGAMNGALTGVGLNGAGLQYAVQETTVTMKTDAGGIVTSSFAHNLMTGVVGFSGPTQDVNIPIRAVGVIDGWYGGSDLQFEDDLEDLAATGIYRGDVDGEMAAASRVIDSASGLTEFVGEARGYKSVSGATDSLYEEVPATIKIGSAVNRDVGSTTVSGVTLSWGRWEGGSVDIYSRDGSTKLGTIDNSGRSIHWLTTSALNSQMFTLPLTGTATYAIAGNTSPTDLHGNVGKLTSATLNADFGKGKVDAGVAVSFNSPNHTGTWNISASNIPLGGSEFESSTALNGINGIVHSTTCSGSACGAQTVGRIEGHFFGGGQGAVMAYGMATGTLSTRDSVFVPSNTVTGLVVMKK